MRKRKLGNSDLQISEVGLGCMSLGSEEKYAIHIIDKALDVGINYLDTADLYDQGMNEEFVGKAIKGRRQELIVATKVGNRFTKGKSGWIWDPSKAHIMEAVKSSLKRLDTDYIDLYQLHGGTIEDHIDETIEAFEQLKQEGVIRYYGISSIRPNVIREYVKHSSIVSVMMQYSILDRRPEEFFPFLKANNVSVVTRGSLAKGILSGKKRSEGYMDYNYQELNEVITSLTSELDRSLTEIALRYCLHDTTVASVITGASKIEQIIENCQAVSSKPLTELEVQKIIDLTKETFYIDHR